MRREFANIFKHKKCIRWISWDDLEDNMSVARFFIIIYPTQIIFEYSYEFTAMTNYNDAILIRHFYMWLSKYQIEQIFSG